MDKDKIKDIIFFLLLVAFLVLAWNMVGHIHNQSIINHILIDNGIYELPNDYAKAEKVNHVVHEIVKEKTKSQYHIGFCRTAQEVLDNGGACGDNVFMAVSMFRLLDIDSHPIGIYKNESNDDFSHVMVEVNINNTWIIIDPLYDTFVISDEIDGNTATFRYGHLSFLKSLGIIKYQPYPMINCNLRTIAITSFTIFILCFFYLILFGVKKKNE